MQFIWDPEKSEANLKERGFDFEFATLIFSGPTLEKKDLRKDYGELRVIAVGLAQNVALTVVYTDRELESREIVRRIISSRRSSRRERNGYENAF
ncbi:MAG: BrnT family toxin [Gemmatimonadetes bacterium]|nr:BrnT family toxin [Gemmatimonadota bacterium]